MSYHYPQHVGALLSPTLASSNGAAQPSAFHPPPSTGATEKVLSAAHADEWIRPTFGTVIETAENPSGVEWHEAVTLVGGFLLPFVTAWLIWAALAEAVLAAAGAL